MRSQAIIQSAAEVLRPPRRMAVADAAQQYLHIHRPGGASGLWDAALTPYMIEPLNRLADRSVEAVVFVGPARSGKSASLLLGWLTYIVVCDPGDFLMLHMTESTARDFSKDDIARAHRYSPELKARLSPFSHHDNVFDKSYRTGMRLLVGWPSITQLSGRTLRYVAITDYDRMAENIDGEGDAFSLARKRVQTFLSSGRVAVESSPGWAIDNPRWQPMNAHEGPPCRGIFGLYNTGDRRRWYWPCPHCGEHFTSPASIEALCEVEGTTCLACLACGAAIDKSHKAVMNRRGIWLADGQSIDRDGTISGTARKSTIASYWLTGPAAAYQSWASLWLRHAQAVEELEKTGSEEKLKVVLTGDFGAAYRPRKLNILRDSRTLQSRAEDLEKRTIPEGVFFITAAVDVQGNRFVVQVVGWGRSGEQWLIDRYNLKWSRRPDSRGAFEPIDPAAYIDDWQILVDQVVQKPYPWASSPTTGLAPVVVAIDSGGRAGVTERAYLFWRRARTLGLGAKIQLVKGTPRADAPRIRRSYPDSEKRSQFRKANARGEIPLLLLNSNILKDTVASNLEVPEPGPGFIHLPRWLGAWFFDELTAETRTSKGWENPGKGRNEAFDLFCYNCALYLMLGGETLNWERPPAWADPIQSQVVIPEKGMIAPLTQPEQKPKPRRVKPRAKAWVL